MKLFFFLEKQTQTQGWGKKLPYLTSWPQKKIIVNQLIIISSYSKKRKRKRKRELIIISQKKEDKKIMKKISIVLWGVHCCCYICSVLLPCCVKQKNISLFQMVPLAMWGESIRSLQTILHHWLDNGLGSV